MPDKLDPDWICGFMTGDGSFYVSVTSSNRIAPVMSITLSSKERLLLVKIQQYFNMGTVYPLDPSSYTIPPISNDYKIFDIYEVVEVTHHFDRYKLMGNKLTNYLIWKEVVHLVVNGEHLTPEGLKKVEYLVGQLNK